MQSMQNATKNLLLKALTGIAIAIPAAANATCWEAASQSYGIPVDVLKAVAKTESGFNPKALNKNTNGTYDIGLMQINSAWLPRLEGYGVTEQSLHDACTNLKVGAWILSNNAQKLGWNWNAIGAYNVGCAKLDAAECGRRRNQYAWKVHTAMNKVGDLRAPAKGALVSYAQGATPVSSSALRAAVVPADPKKIMVIQMGESTKPTPMQLASLDDGIVQPRGLNVDGFMNYEGEQDDE